MTLFILPNIKVVNIREFLEIYSLYVKLSEDRFPLQSYLAYRADFVNFLWLYIALPYMVRQKGDSQKI